MKKPKIILVTGPTAVGKTRIAHLLAGEFRGEIINADSMQVYRYLDIGTAKPSAVEREGIPYHLIDIRLPTNPLRRPILRAGPGGHRRTGPKGTGSLSRRRDRAVPAGPAAGIIPLSQAGSGDPGPLDPEGGAGGK